MSGRNRSFGLFLLILPSLLFVFGPSVHGKAKAVEHVLVKLGIFIGKEMDKQKKDQSSPFSQKEIEDLLNQEPSKETVEQYIQLAKEYEEKKKKQELFLENIKKPYEDKLFQSLWQEEIYGINKTKEPSWSKGNTSLDTPEQHLRDIIRRNSHQYSSNVGSRGSSIRDELDSFKGNTDWSKFHREFQAKESNKSSFNNSDYKSRNQKESDENVAFGGFVVVSILVVAGIVFIRRKRNKRVSNMR